MVKTSNDDAPEGLPVELPLRLVLITINTIYFIDLNCLTSWCEIHRHRVFDEYMINDTHDYDSIEDREGSSDTELG